MNLDTTYAPPINNACVPDVYNRLDAEVIERTRVANRQLNMKLLLEQKIISKYKQEAERFLLLEKSRTTRELARITQTLPAVVSVRDFDDKNSRPVDPHGHHKKNYLSAKNEDPVCRRCYIHHLPTKKKFYRYTTPQPLPTIQDSKLSNTSRNYQHQKTITKSYSTHKHGATGNDVMMIINEEEGQEEMATKSAEPLPSVEAFKFLEREKWGREIDLNHSLPPRLMPNEIWKNVVKDVCNQCSKEPDEPSTHLGHAKVNDIFFRGRAGERRAGIRNRRQSLVIAEKPYEITQTRPRKLSKVNSRINLHGRPSDTNDDPKPYTHSNGVV